MTRSPSPIVRLYDSLILKRPVRVIVLLMAVAAFLAYHAQNFRLDASAETLVLEGDQDLEYARLISSRYGQQEFLFLAFTPRGDLLSDQSLDTLSRLQEDLQQLDGVTSVFTILDAPLLESPRLSLKELAGGIRTLRSPAVDREMARREIRNSPIYRNLLVSPDLRTTALQINLPEDERYQELLNRRNRLREKRATGDWAPSDAVEYRDVSRQFQQHRDSVRADRHLLINSIRAVMDNYRQKADLFLGGVSMIADDLIRFIKNDLQVFGLGVLFFLVVTLSVIFRQPRWVLLPMACCAVSALNMIGLLGLFGWEVTVISSNFISLQLIITMAIAIHLIVRYRELQVRHPEAEQRTLVLETVRLKFKPCLYAALTTMAGFGSLVFCDILPVINFGWMMIGGIVVSMVITFLLFPAALVLLKKSRPAVGAPSGFALMPAMAAITEKHGRMFLFCSAGLMVLSVAGTSRLAVENSFIDYFKQGTEIYQGMKVIDQQLGGTTPLEVVIDLDETEPSETAAATDTPPAGTGDEFDQFSEFDEAPTDDRYWFTAAKMADIVRIHEYLDRLPETGKVLSLATLLKVAERFNDGKPLDNFQLAVLYGEIPLKYRKQLLSPYVSVEHNQVRFFVRVKDSQKDLKRNELLQKIRRDLAQEHGLAVEDFHLTGLLVLYNNMLQNLFDSQILTLGITLLALLGMFLLLFRSFKLALIAIFPNVLSIGTVLGFMGWMNIPLDMMTITIAAISVGIAVDDTIHYIHRFRLEFAKDGNYLSAMHRCHGSIGYAMYYTSVTIIIGFSILALSNFIPSIYFGLLTGLAMLIALVAALTLLPELLVFFKPFGRRVKQPAADKPAA
jgi:predicted RND superfamily exporter protein